VGDHFGAFNEREAFSRPAAEMMRPSTVRAEHMIYAHLLLTLTSIYFERSNQLVYGWLLEERLGSAALGLLWTTLFFSSLLLPLAVVVRWFTEVPPRRWSWLAVPLSFALSIVQLGALLILRTC
jgi:hypothetical protein